MNEVASTRPRTTIFPTSTPEAEGIPSAAILAFIDAIEEGDHPLRAAHSLMLLRHGKVVAEGWWDPYQPSFPHMLYSLSKSFTSTAIGIAVAEGLLRVDDPVLSYFPDDAPANPGANLRAMTVEHLLTMNTGHHEDTTGAVWRGEDDNWPRAFLALPVEHEPGSWFVYNTAATYMLSAIITRLTGQPLIDYLRPRLFDPLGIANPAWDEDPHGRSIGGSGLHITTADIARFGQLYLQKGQWNGQQIVPEAWVDAATQAHSDNSNTQSNRDWTAGYGYQFWRNRDGSYRGDGAFGQFCLVLPDQDAVLAITSGRQDMQHVLDIVFDTLIPSLGQEALPEDAAAVSALGDRLASLSLPLVNGSATSPIAAAVSGVTYTMATNDLGIDRLRFDVDGETPTVTITEGAGEQTIVAGYRTWEAGTLTRPGLGTRRVAASGAWTDEATFELRLCYTEFETGIVWRTVFSEGGIAVDVEPNVAWQGTGAVSLTGRASTGS
jgi:CubicO group peptidase (beta-lactamase class C family)